MALEMMVCPECRRWFRFAEPGDVLKSLVAYKQPVPALVVNVDILRLRRRTHNEADEFYLSVDLCEGCQKHYGEWRSFFDDMGARVIADG